jgi:hypothetical protein
MTQTVAGFALAAAGSGDASMVTNLGAVAAVAANFSSMAPREDMPIAWPNGMLVRQGP